MTVRDDPTAKGQVIPRSRWRFVDGGTVALDGGFEPGRIYDVVYRTADPRVLGCGLAGTRDLISFLKYDTSRGQPDAGPALRDRLGRLAERPLPAAFPLSGLQRGRAGPPGVRRRVRSGRRRRPRIVQPPLRPGVARRAAVLQHPVSGRSVSVHRRTRQPIRRRGVDRQPARARRANRHGAEDLSPADQLGVLQSRRLARAHRSRPARRTPICRRTRAST